MIDQADLVSTPRSPETDCIASPSAASDWSGEPGHVAKLPPRELQLFFQQLVSKGSSDVHAGRPMQESLNEAVAAIKRLADNGKI